MKTPRQVSYKELKEDFPKFGQYGQLFYDCPSNYGQMSLLEQAIVNEIVFSLQPDNILEFGRCDGLTSLNLASASQGQVTTVDLPDPLTEIYAASNSAKAKSRWGRFGMELFIDEVLVNSKDFKSDIKFNLILIDAGHEYDEIKADTEKALTLLESGGSIIWHDYYKRSFPGVTAYLSEKSEEWNIKWINCRADFLETSLCYAKL